MCVMSRKAIEQNLHRQTVKLKNIKITDTSQLDCYIIAIIVAGRCFYIMIIASGFTTKSLHL